MKTHWAAASVRFTMMFVNNPFGHKCDVRDRLWFLRSLKPTKEKHLSLLNTFPEEPLTENCVTCEKLTELGQSAHVVTFKQICLSR
ncbi:uncharacterized protein TNCT_707161 [Trichonephila clavata]|uniref:Uncharacterized protein n=1 Tax=Trichonephila clavata TaxID=2740835 RepID=A0A8X6I045_TRICU|nr:uncharacterized protein TNCT_707161 [Trichonephila clavata]